MQLMGALQPELPSPTIIPKNTYKIILDLKDCFYTILLSPQDCHRCAFCVPSSNFQGVHEKISLECLASEYSKVCQKFVAQAIQNIRDLFPKVYTIHYIDDIACP